MLDHDPGLLGSLEAAAERSVKHLGISQCFEAALSLSVMVGSGDVQAGEIDSCDR